MKSMKRVLLLLIVASLCLTAAAQVQPVSATTSVAKTYRQFDDGIKDGTYSNHYFGLNYKLPTGYVAQDQETRERILEAGREAMQRDKEAAAAGPDRGFFMLMIATPEDQMVPQISLMAQDVLLVPQIKSGAEFVNATGDALVQQGFTKLKGPESVKIGGKEFFRSDFTHTNGAKQAIMATIVRRHAIAYILTALSNEDLESAVASVKATAFTETK
jgi:hypothetical protein